MLTLPSNRPAKLLAYPGPKVLIYTQDRTRLDPRLRAALWCAGVAVAAVVGLVVWP
jgi:hypothetical protein